MKKNALQWTLTSVNRSRVTALLIVSLLLSGTQVFARLQERLNVVLKNASLEEVFTAIEKQSSYRFLYKTDLVDVRKKINITQRNAELETILKDAFEGTDIYYTVKEGDLVIITPTAPKVLSDIQQDDKVIKGKVVDVNGDPLPGAAVFLKADNSVGTITDIEGNYELKIPADAQIIVYSFIGMENQEVSFAGQSKIDITLLANYEVVDEVVVVAYGTQAKSNLTGSVSTVKGEKLKDVTTPSVAGLIQGKAAGVMVTNSSGRPGEGATIRIRGKGSLNSTVDPLWVIDGVVSGTGAQLSPNEIESFTILKDASATALYGSRAANGVIIVTTKKGRAGENKVNFSVVTGFSNLDRGNFEVMNAQELYDYQKDWKDDVTEDLLKYDTDWFDKGTQTGISQNYNLSISGGNEKIRTFIMGDYFKETGAVKGYDYERFKMRLNLDYSVNDRLTVRTKLAGSYWSDDNKQHDIGSFWLYMPWDSPYYADGTVRNPQDDELEAAYGETWYGRDKRNYYYDLQWNWARGKQLGVDGNLTLEYKLSDDFTLVSTNNVGYKYHLTESYKDKRSIAGANENGLLTNSESFQTTRFTNQMLKYKKNVGEHNIAAFFGYEYSDYLWEGFNATGKGINPGGEVLDITSSPMTIGGNKYEWKMQSLLFNANYVYKNRYMTQFSFRNDGSSKFGEDKRHGNFFTVSAGWSLHEESFMADLDWLNLLKLRASYGSVGNTPNNNYAHLSLYTYARMYNEIPAAWPDQLGNESLTWEKAFESNFAIDARMFNRFDLSLELYDKNTSDLLDRVQLPALTGYSYIWRNVGEVNNRGFELTLGADVIRTRDFNWHLDVNLGVNKNEIKELFQGNSVDAGYFKRWEEGRDMDTYFMREWAGVDADTGAPLWYMVDEETDEYILDEEGNRTTTDNWNDAGRKFLGTSSPDLFGGINTAFAYKNLTLTASFSYMIGNDIYHSSRELFDSDGAYPTFNQVKFQDDWSRWKEAGDNATHPKIQSNNSNKTSSRYMEDGSYLRMRNVTLSYNLPKVVLEPLTLSNARFYISGDNLFTISKFTGIDPEVAANNNGVGGTDRYPLTKKFVVGLNVTF
jgi:TonB-linked SusC/RagA family outer membrane protein